MREFSLDSLINSTANAAATVVSRVKNALDDDSGTSSAEEDSTTTTTTSAPTTTTMTPVTTTRAPIVTTRAPAIATMTPATTTRAPTATTRVPTATTRLPTATTRTPTTTTESPRVTTSIPIATTKTPSVTTKTSTTTPDLSTDSEASDAEESASSVTSTRTPTATTTPEPTSTPTPTPTADSMMTPTPTPTAATYESTQGIASNNSDGAMSTGAILGVVVASACVLFLVAAFVVYRKRKLSRDSGVKSPGNGGVRPFAISATHRDSAGSFGTLSSGRSKQKHSNVDINLSDANVYNNGVAGAATLGSMGSMTTESGIWNDAVLVAARIPLASVQLDELVSRGGFGQVFTGRYNGETVAVKTLLPENRKDMNEIMALFVEIKVMAELEHPRIVRFVGVAWDSLSNVSCVTEFMVGGDLRGLLEHFECKDSRRPHGFDFDKVKIALHVVHALTYLHSMSPAILHRDLKSRNVLLNSQLDAKLTDFGVSRARSDELMTAAVGTSLWMAPEVMTGGRYGDKADMFSFGVLMSEIDTHVMPYSTVLNATGQKPTEAAILQRVALGKLRVSFSSECLPELRELGLACVSVDPLHRPTAPDALYKLQLALKGLQTQEVTL